MMKTRIKHLDSNVGTPTGKTACGSASLAHRIVTTLANFIKHDFLFPCWRCKKTDVFTNLGGVI